MLAGTDTEALLEVPVAHEFGHMRKDVTDGMIAGNPSSASGVRISHSRPRAQGPGPKAAFTLAALLTACTDLPRLEVSGVDFVAPAGSQAPDLEVTPGGELLLTYTEPTGAGHAVRVVAREHDAWTTRSTVVENDSLFVNWADFPSVRATAGGRLIAHWLQRVAPDRYAYHVFMRVSDDSGRTWGAPFRPHRDRSPTEHGFVAMTPWQDGLAAIWLDGRNTARGGGHDGGTPSAERRAPSTDTPAMALHFTTLSATGPAPDVAVDHRVCECCQTALAATSSGLVAAYRDRTEGEIRDVVTARFVDGVWSAAAKVHDDGWHYPGCPVNGPQLAARNDTVAVAWFTAANDRPRAAVAFSTDGGVTFGNRAVIDDGRPAGRVDVLWLGTRVLVVWLEDVAEGGEVRARLVAPDGTVSPSVTVGATTAARAAGFPRAAALGDSVYVAWTHAADTPRVHVTRLTLR